MLCDGCNNLFCFRTSWSHLRLESLKIEYLGQSESCDLKSHARPSAEHIWIHLVFITVWFQYYCKLSPLLSLYRKKTSVCEHQYVVRASSGEWGSERISAEWARPTLKATTITKTVTTASQSLRSRNATSRRRNVWILCSWFWPDYLLTVCRNRGKTYLFSQSFPS